jgi:hypothetical protein
MLHKVRGNIWLGRATEISTNALGLTFCVMNDNLPTVTIFSASYSLCHKVSLSQVPSLYFFSIKHIGKSTAIPVHFTKACGREEVELHTFSSFVLDGGESSASYPASLNVGTHWTGDRVGPRDWTLRRRNIAFLCKKLKDDSWSAGPVAQT